MPKKKSWKERQREKQRAKEAERIRLEVERKYKKGRKGWSLGKHFNSITDIRIFKALESVDVELMKALSEKIIERIVPSGELKT